MKEGVQIKSISTFKANLSPTLQKQKACSSYSKTILSDKSSISSNSKMMFSPSLQSLRNLGKKEMPSTEKDKRKQSDYFTSMGDKSQGSKEKKSPRSRRASQSSSLGQMQENQLFKAVREGNLKLVALTLAKSKHLLDIRDDKGYTLLHLAARWNQEAIVENLIRKYKCNVKAKTQNGYTALHVACFYKNK